MIAAAANAAAVTPTATGCLLILVLGNKNDMNEGEDESNGPVDKKKLVCIPLSSPFTANDSEDHIQGELTIPSFPSKPKALIVFAHGSDSGIDSPRNQYVAKVLNENGFATLLSDLLTPVETESDIKSQKVMGKFLLINKMIFE